jgi:branched-chain amino acid transport system ATP-binding protein
LDLAGLSDRAEAPTHLLNLYEKKRLMIATALATGPKLLLLDEPLAGLTAAEIADTLKLAGELKKRGVTIVLVEHNMRGVFQVADRLVVMHRGQKLAEGTPADVAKNPQVVSVYLGEGYL